MDTLRDTFGLAVGYSDHTLGIAIPVAAVARGASVIEKHITLDRSAEGPDHAASIEPNELADMVANIRAVEAALGTGVKEPAACESANAGVARRSLIAARPIRRGEVFSPDNIAVRRPGTGRSPMAYWDVIGAAAERDYHPGELI